MGDTHGNGECTTGLDYTSRRTGRLNYTNGPPGNGAKPGRSKCIDGLCTNGTEFTTRNITRNTPRNTIRNTPRNTPKSITRNTPRNITRNTPRNITRNTPKSITRNTPKSITRNTPRNITRNTPRNGAKPGRSKCTDGLCTNGTEFTTR